MPDESFSIGEAALDGLFPFHVVVGADGGLLNVGSALRRAVPEIGPGQPFAEHFRISRPGRLAGAESEPERLQGHLLRLVAGKGGLELRGQVTALDGGSAYLIAASPIVATSEELNRLGLHVSDFALHDSAPDLIILLQASQTALQDTRRLASRLEATSEELRSSKEEAERASQAKSEFLAVMSHEIRTPLHGLSSTIHLLGDISMDAEQRELLDVMGRCNETLGMILGNILDFSKIEAGKIELDSVEFELKDLVERTVEVFAEQARAKGVQLRTPKQIPALQLKGDSVRVGQILTNLLSNALKFTTEGHVALELEARDDGSGRLGIDMRIADTGAGMTMAASESLFEAFSQADRSTTRRFGGTGLGLAISRRLARMMGGDVALTHTALGEGSTFSVHLSLEKCQEDDGARGDEAGGRPAVASFPGRRILVAEDNVTNRFVICKLLERRGLDLEFAGDGRAAVEALDRGEYDLVLMDLQMPHMDGLEATRRIRSSGGEQAGIPIIALTANAMTEQRNEALDAGMDHFLTKPLRPEDLDKALKRFLESPSGDAGPGGA